MSNFCSEFSRIKSQKKTILYAQPGRSAQECVKVQQIFVVIVNLEKLNALLICSFYGNASFFEQN